MSASRRGEPASRDRAGMLSRPDQRRASSRIAPRRPSTRSRPRASAGDVRPTWGPMTTRSPDTAPTDPAGGRGFSRRHGFVSTIFALPSYAPRSLLVTSSSTRRFGVAFRRGLRGGPFSPASDGWGGPDSVCPRALPLPGPRQAVIFGSPACCTSHSRACATAFASGPLPPRGAAACWDVSRWHGDVPALPRLAVPSLLQATSSCAATSATSSGRSDAAGLQAPAPAATIKPRRTRRRLTSSDPPLSSAEARRGARSIRKGGCDRPRRFLRPTISWESSPAASGGRGRTPPFEAVVAADPRHASHEVWREIGPPTRIGFSSTRNGRSEIRGAEIPRSGRLCRIGVALSNIGQAQRRRDVAARVEAGYRAALLRGSRGNGVSWRRNSWARRPRPRKGKRVSRAPSLVHRRIGRELDHMARAYGRPLLAFSTSGGDHSEYEGRGDRRCAPHRMGKVKVSSGRDDNQSGTTRARSRHRTKCIAVRRVRRPRSRPASRTIARARDRITPGIVVGRLHREHAVKKPDRFAAARVPGVTTSGVHGRRLRRNFYFNNPIATSRA